MKKFITFTFILLFFEGFAQTTIVNQPIINEYAQVTEVNFCKNSMSLANNAENNFSIGEKVLIVQMKGALTINSNSPSSNFGNVEDYLAAGSYEFNEVKSINLGSVNGLQFKYELSNPYNSLLGKVQVIKVPQYVNVEFQTTLTALPWDGNIGGIIVFEASGDVNLQANIFASEIGFRGGSFSNDINCYSAIGGFSGLTCLPGLNCGGVKGEGIGRVYELGMKGRGKDANGGGGGNDHNAGGGGGANGGNGGRGGDNDLATQFCNGSGGQGGQANQYNANRILMGGAGGAGDSNNNTGTIGGNAGGTILIKANSITANGFKIVANGGSANAASGDGAGGGGAGGTVILDVNAYSDNLIIELKGGKGGDVSDPGNCPGVGGGGSGGKVWVKQNTTPSNISLDALGGSQGAYLSATCNGLNLGVEDGENGGFAFNYSPFISQNSFTETQVTAFDNNLICAGNPSSLSANIVSSADYNFSWIYNGIIISSLTDFEVFPVTRGVNEYVATVIWDVFGQNCIEEDPVAIIVRNPEITIVVSPTEPVEIGAPVFLNAVINPPSQNYTYQWLQDYVMPNDDRNAVVEPFESTNFCITVEDEIGCIDTQCVLVPVILPFSGVPDAFSPNNDGLNDIFKILPEAQLLQTSLKIYDRWGKQIFETYDVFEWDGKANGVLQCSDSYVWIAEFEHKNTKERSTQSGLVTLIR